MIHVKLFLLITHGRDTPVSWTHYHVLMHVSTEPSDHLLLHHVSYAYSVILGIMKVT